MANLIRQTGSKYVYVLYGMCMCVFTDRIEKRLCNIAYKRFELRNRISKNKTKISFFFYEREILFLALNKKTYHMEYFGKLGQVMQ